MPVPNRRIFNDSYNQFLTTHAELQPHREMFDFVFGEFLAQKIDVFFNNLIEGCQIVRDDQTYEALYLLIGARKRNETITFVWSVYHEYGHLLQGDPTKDETEKKSQALYEREKDAWIKAEAILQSTEIFQTNSESFYKFRDERLNSYLKP